MSTYRPRRRLPIGAALLASMSVAACGGGPEPIVWTWRPARTELHGPVSLSLVPSPNHPLVRATVDGHEALLVVDTGAETTLLDRGFAERAGLALLPLSNAVTAEKGSGRSHAFARAARVGRLALGEALAFDLEPLVFDARPLAIDGLDGVLGMDVLGQWAVLVDAAHGELWLAPSGALLETLGELYVPGTAFHQLALIEPGPCPRVELSAGERTFPAVIDTGGATSSFPDAAIASLGLEPVEEKASHDIAGTATRTWYRVESLDFGALSFVDFKVAGRTDGEGTLGYPLLRGIVFAVDAPGRMLWFAREPERKSR